MSELKSPTDDIREMAEGAKAIYEGFVNAGFTREEAFELTKVMIAAVAR